MAEGRERDEWNRVCWLMTMHLNSHRKPGGRLVQIDQLHPMKKDPLASRPKPEQWEDISILKVFLRK